ncbi:MAG: hypothetical protein RJB65_2343 [Actinomycetota bacterium]|jgi:hypothetical protein
MSRPLVLACGALVSELRAVLAADGLDDVVEVRYLPANLHNRPERITPSVAEMLDELDPQGERTVLLGYADCGTGGALDSLVAERPNVSRLPGNHCYEFFAGTSSFEALAADELGTFWLTDFLAKHFRALVWEGLGLDRHPELLSAYFGHYTRLVLLSQTTDPDSLATVVAAAEDAAAQLGLRFEHHPTGLSAFAAAVTKGTAA